MQSKFIQISAGPKIDCNPKGALSIYDSIQARLDTRVSVQGVESLWGDCRFIPTDWES